MQEQDARTWPRRMQTLLDRSHDCRLRCVDADWDTRSEYAGPPAGTLHPLAIKLSQHRDRLLGNLIEGGDRLGIRLERSLGNNQV